MGTDVFTQYLFMPLPCDSWLFCKNRRFYFSTLTVVTQVKSAHFSPLVNVFLGSGKSNMQFQTVVIDLITGHSSFSQLE